MLRPLALSMLLACAAVAPGFAKNLALPAKDPAATLVIPDSWKPEAIDFGWQAKSPDGEVFFSVEYAAGARIQKMLAANDTWLKDNKIKPKAEPMEQEFDYNGLPAKVIKYVAQDENGDTEVDFVIVTAGQGRVIMLTLWASKEERAKNTVEIDAIKASFKKIN